MMDDYQDIFAIIGSSNIKLELSSQLD